MPTPYPEPMRDATNREDYESRIKAVYLLNILLDSVHDYAYCTRSHMPNGVDSTEFFASLHDVRSFFNSRPDWTNDMLRQVFNRFFPVSIEDIEKNLEDRQINANWTILMFLKL